LEKREAKQEERGKNTGGLKKKTGGILRPLSKNVLHKCRDLNKKPLHCQT
jgi:hypothetical protein